MDEHEKTEKRNMTLFLLITAATGLALGLSDQVLANYFKDAYNVGALQRGFIELPRELPGVLCTIVIVMFHFLGDIRISIIAQLLSVFGMAALGFFTPSFSVMLVFLFIYSMGMHIFMPLGDSIALSLTKGQNVGRIIGRFNGIRTGFMMLAGIITFVGFKSGAFSFKNPVAVFIISAMAFAAVAVLLHMLGKGLDIRRESKKPNFIVRKEYTLYYIICLIFGGRKQIMYVYCPWVLIELLGFKADTMAILAVIGAFIGIFFMPVVGRLIDRFGVKKIMMIEALTFILIYFAYGYLCVSLNKNTLTVSTVVLFFVCLLFIVDKMTAQFAMVRSIFMREIALFPEEVTPSLSLGVSIDHVVSISLSAVCGWIWFSFGPQWVFVLAGLLSLGNLFVASKI